MATLPTQTSSLAGLTPDLVAAGASGDKFSPGGGARLHVRNGSASAVTVTFASNPCNHGSVHPLEVTVPAAGEKIIGPFGEARFATDANGLVAVTYSATTDVTVAVVA